MDVLSHTPLADKNGARRRKSSLTPEQAIERLAELTDVLLKLAGAGGSIDDILLEHRYGNLRDEFAPWSWEPVITRSELEHPERAYRRGYQQGAGEVYHTLEKSGLIDDRLKRKLRDFIYGPVYHWRYDRVGNPRLGRRLNGDRAPKLELGSNG